MIGRCRPGAIYSSRRLHRGERWRREWARTHVVPGYERPGSERRIRREKARSHRHAQATQIPDAHIDTDTQVTLPGSCCQPSRRRPCISTSCLSSTSAGRMSPSCPVAPLRDGPRCATKPRSPVQALPGHSEHPAGPAHQQAYDREEAAAEPPHRDQPMRAPHPRLSQGVTVEWLARQCIFLHGREYTAGGRRPKAFYT